MKITEVILGGPGAGKTEALLKLVEDQLEKGAQPEAIAFVTFTRAAAKEAKDRACAKFKLDPKQLPWFRTLHSVAFEALGLRRDQVMQRSHWRDLGELLGLKFGRSPIAPDEGPLLPGDGEGDQGRYLIQLANATQRPLREIWQASGAGIGWERLEQLAGSLDSFKRDMGLIDFSDMLRLFLERGAPVSVQAAFIDEAQDLTAEQWRAARLAFRDTPLVYIGGDDDQAIYKWSGADLGQFLTLDARRRVLPVSRRLPQKVFTVAEQIVSQIGGRYPKIWHPKPEAGTVSYLGAADLVDLSVPGDWLLLARHRYQLLALGTVARGQGVPYSISGRSAVDPDTVTAIRAWETLRKGTAITAEHANLIQPFLENRDPMHTPQFHTVGDLGTTPMLVRAVGWPLDQVWHDAFIELPAQEREFYRSCLRRGEDLIGAPRIRVSTIHGAKGAEADNVLVLPDMSRRTWAGYESAPDAEHRVFYVGVTRTKKNLHLVYPSSSKAYAWPEQKS